jgi:hypothetical protein
MDEDWPAPRSFEIYWRVRNGLEEAATAQFAALTSDTERRRAS